MKHLWGILKGTVDISEYHMSIKLVRVLQVTTCNTVDKSQATKHSHTLESPCLRTHFSEYIFERYLRAAGNMIFSIICQQPLILLNMIFGPSWFQTMIYIYGRGTNKLQEFCLFEWVARIGCVDSSDVPKLVVFKQRGIPKKFWLKCSSRRWALPTRYLLPEAPSQSPPAFRFSKNDRSLPKALRGHIGSGPILSDTNLVLLQIFPPFSQ